MISDERRGRRITEALRRGVQAVAANPELLLGPLVTTAATVAIVLLALLGLLLPLGLGVAHEMGSAIGGRGRPLADLLSESASRLAALPLWIAAALVAALILGTALLLLAAYVNGGTLAVLLAADRTAPEGAERRSFRLDRVLTVFFEAAGRFAARFFWLINVYALVLTFFVALLLVPLLFLVLGAFQGHFGAPLAAFLLALPIVVVGAILTRVTYLASAWAVVADDVGVLEGIGRGLTRIRESFGRTVGLYFLLLAIAMAIAGLFAVPRFALSFSSWSHAAGTQTAFFGLTLALILVQTAVGFAYGLVTTGAFVSLWTGRPAAAMPPVAFRTAVLPPPIPETPAASHESPAPTESA